MKTYKRILSFLLVFSIIASCLFIFPACEKNEQKSPQAETSEPRPPKTETPETPEINPLYSYAETPKTNPLYPYEEIREFNYNSRIPFILGSFAEEINKKFERISGTLNHSENYRSKEYEDLAYMLSRIEAVYGEADSASPVYVIGITIMPEDKIITPIGNGKTKAEYITSRTVLGVKLGDDIKDAEAVFKGFGYKKIYEEVNKSNLPMSREFTFQKGILLISCGVEVKNEISFMRIWIPMHDESIEKVNAGSNLPANLGLHYSVYANPDFAYDSKTQTERVYKHKDGVTVCRLRGFPDVRDMMMNADIYFENAQYDVFGAKTGMTLDEAAGMLLAAGCAVKTDSENLYTYGNVLIELNVESGSVKSIEVSLIESTQLPDLRDSGK